LRPIDGIKFVYRNIWQMYMASFDAESAEKKDLFRYDLTRRWMAKANFSS